MSKIIFLLTVLFSFGAFVYVIGKPMGVLPIVPQTSPSSSPLPTRVPLESTKILSNSYHVFQTFNNCGPAALSMALSYYGINESQQKLGQILRPYQHPKGNNDDKSVTLSELADLAGSYGFIAYHRPNGDIEDIKQFIHYDMPVITRTWLKPNDDIGHYRIVKGYDDTTQELIQDDSLQGKNLRYTYFDFNDLWQKFNFEYLVLVPNDKVEVANIILGEDRDELTAWKSAVNNSLTQLQSTPQDIYARFNLSVAYYHTKNYQLAVKEYEQVEANLPFRMLWYQIEPILAYFELGNYPKVFEITDKIINNHNRAFSELYLLRGEIYKRQGKTELAKSEFEKAVFYNQNLEPAKAALNSL